MSMYLGSKIIQSPTISRRCDKMMDIYGRHASHCPYGPFLIRRHNHIRDLISVYLKQAQIEHTLEERYKDFNVDNEMIEEQERKVPGDIVIKSWYNHASDDAHMDVTIANIFCSTYIKGAAKGKFDVHKLKEKMKQNKYQ